MKLENMLAIRIVALVLIVASVGVLATFSGFEELRNMPSGMHAAERIDIPMWIGTSGLLLGAMLLIGFAARR
jgi:hypothetical protein